MDKRRPSQKIQFREWDNQGCIQIFNEPTIPRQPVIDTIQGFITEKGIKLEKVIVDPGQAKQWEFDKVFKQLEYVYNSPRHMTGAIRYLEKGYP